MVQGKEITRYLKSSLELSCLAKVDFSNSERFYRQSYSVIESGLLEEDAASQLLSELKEHDRKAYQEGKPVPVVVSLKALIKLQVGSKHQGILLLSAGMNHQGGLEYDPEKNFAWIPLDRLRMTGARELDVMVGNLSAFRKFQIKTGKTLESKIESWQDYVSYAEKMFRTVQDQKQVEDDLCEYSYEIETDFCYIKYNDDFDATAPIVALYEHLLKEKDAPKLYNTMINGRHVKQAKDDVIKHNMEANMSNACSHISQGFHLAPSQRRAIQGFNQLNEGEVLAISGPPGTGKTTTLQDVVANLITQHALQGKSAPIIVGMSTNNQAVTNIIDSFGSIASETPGILDHRWLPHIKIDYDGKGKEVSRSVEGHLPGLATYCPSKGKIQEAKFKGYLFDFANRSEEGVYSQYSSESYCSKAIHYYREMASNFFGEELSDLKLISEKLQSRLRQIDRTRIRLIQEYNQLHVSLMKEDIQYDELHQAESTKLQLEREHEYYQERLKFWTSLEVEHRPKLFFIRPKQDNVIAANKNIDEDIVADCKTLTEVCDAYRVKLGVWETLRAKAQNNIISLNRDIQQQKSQLKKCAQRIEELAKQCRLTEKQSKRLSAVLERDNFSISNLDCILDTTVRNAEFWLAVHFYECAWLLACKRGEIIASEDRFKSTKAVRNTYWSQAPCLTPCFVMTAYMLPRMFKCHTRDDCEKFDLERIDLLIIDEAGQVDVPIGLASFGLAKRAVVVGDTKQLNPIWSFDEESDEEIAKSASFINNEWESLKATGCTASPNSSLMRLATTVSPWKYSEEEGGLFLSEHYRCSPQIILYCNRLLYKGLLEPQRLPSAEDDKNPLKTIFQPMLYHIVSDSRSTKCGSSRKNLAEAQAIAQWIAGNFELIKEKYQGKYEDAELVGVVTPFAAQAKTVSKVLKEGRPDLEQLITIGTAHKLQGAERPIILFSAVYGNNDDQSSFIEQNPKLMNVAVSRAKDMFMVFCSSKRTCESGKVLSTFFALAKEEKILEASAQNELTANMVSSDKDKETPFRSLCKGAAKDNPDPFCEVVEAKTQASQLRKESYAISKLLSEWDSEGVFRKPKPRAQDANSLLAKEGLIKSLGSNEWEPTDEGKALGIIQTATADGKRYCRYTILAKENLLSIFVKNEDRY